MGEGRDPNLMMQAAFGDGRVVLPLRPWKDISAHVAELEAAGHDVSLSPGLVLRNEPEMGIAFIIPAATVNVVGELFRDWAYMHIDARGDLSAISARATEVAAALGVPVERITGDSGHGD